MPEAEVRVTGRASNWLAVATPGATIVTTTKVAARTDLRRVFELWLISRLRSSWTGRCTATDAVDAASGHSWKRRGSRVQESFGGFLCRPMTVRVAMKPTEPTN